MGGETLHMPPNSRLYQYSIRYYGKIVDDILSLNTKQISIKPVTRETVKTFPRIQKKLLTMKCNFDANTDWNISF